MDEYRAGRKLASTEAGMAPETSGAGTTWRTHTDPPYGRRLWLCGRRHDCARMGDSAPRCCGGWLSRPGAGRDCGLAGWVQSRRYWLLAARGVRTEGSAAQVEPQLPAGGPLGESEGRVQMLTVGCGVQLGHADLTLAELVEQEGE